MAGDDWAADQAYELRFWKEQWPLRNAPEEEVRRRRFGAATWFLEAMGFPRQADSRRFAGFSGRVLEVGSGPVGFFDQVEGIDCDAMDSLMPAYAREIPVARLGRVGSTTYLPVTDIADITGHYDFIVCSNVLDHTGDWREFLRRLCAITAREAGSRLLLYTLTRSVAVPGHGQLFTPGSLLDAVRAAGLSVIEHCVVRPYPAPAEGEIFLRARLPPAPAAA